MSTDDPITELVDRYKAGDERALNQLWEHFGRRVIGLARKALGRASVTSLEGEDIAQEVFKTVFARPAVDKYTIENRHELWGLLATITRRKVSKALSRRIKHAEAVRIDRATPVDSLGAAADLLHQCDIEDSVQHVLDSLDLISKEIFLLRLEGLEIQEIASKLAIGNEAVRRKIRDRIKGALERELDRGV